jgi:hypothetical protein
VLMGRPRHGVSLDMVNTVCVKYLGVKMYMNRVWGDWLLRDTSGEHKLANKTSESGVMRSIREVKCDKGSSKEMSIFGHGSRCPINLQASQGEV